VTPTRVEVDGQATGSLSDDADGNGASAKVLFAVLDAGTALTAADFFVV